MAKKVFPRNEHEDSQPLKTLEEQFSVVELNDTAISIVATGDKKYSVVKIKFDLNTGNVGKVEVVQEGLDVYESQYQFKMLSVTEGLFN